MNVCLNRRVVDPRYMTGHDVVQKNVIDSHLPVNDARLIDSPRGMQITYDSPPLSGYVPPSSRYCDSVDTPTLGYKSREENASSWRYYLSENQSEPFNPTVYGRSYVAAVQDYLDPMSAQKTEMSLARATDTTGLNDVSDGQLHRLAIMSRLQSRMDEQKFGTKFVVRQRPLTCETLASSSR